MPDQNPSTDLSFLQFHSSTVRMRVDEQRIPWFQGQDCGDVLSIAQARGVIRKFPDNEKRVYTVNTLGGPQDMIFINPHGLYRLIFKSRRPEAETFKLWVFDVIENIRQTGSYALPAHEEQPQLSTHTWTPRAEVTFNMIQVFWVFYDRPRKWRTSTDVALLLGISSRLSRDFCKYFTDGGLLDRLNYHGEHGHRYRWNSASEQANHPLIAAMLRAKEALPRDLPETNLPPWERGDDPRKW